MFLLYSLLLILSSCTRGANSVGYIPLSCAVTRKSILFCSIPFTFDTILSEYRTVQRQHQICSEFSPGRSLELHFYDSVQDVKFVPRVETDGISDGTTGFCHTFGSAFWHIASMRTLGVNSSPSHLPTNFSAGPTEKVDYRTGPIWLLSLKTEKAKSREEIVE